MSKCNPIYDALILGGGPAGLSTALGLARQNRTCLVISHNHFRNDGIEASHAVLGHDHIHPQKIWARAREQMERYQTVSYATGEIISAQKQTLPQNRPGFEVKSMDGRSWTGRSLLLATGIKDVFPELDGYAQNWPHNIYQCLFCDGWERRKSQKAILGYPSLTIHDVKVASMALGQDSSRTQDGHARVTILTNGEPISSYTEPAISTQMKALVARGVKIETRLVLRLENTEPEHEGVHVYLQARNDTGNNSGNTTVEERLHFGYLFHKPRTAPTTPHLIKQLGLAIEAGPFGDIVKAQPPMQSTEIPGLFIAGDIGNLMAHVTTAMLSGMGAAAGMTTFLNDWEDSMALKKDNAETAENGDGNEWQQRGSCRVKLQSKLYLVLSRHVCV